MAGDCASFVRGLRLEATARGAAGDSGAGWGDMVPARIWGLIPPCQRELIPRTVGAPSKLALGKAGLWGRLRVDTLDRPEWGEARYQGWPCWHQVEKGWGMYWSLIHGEKEHPAISEWWENQSRPPSLPTRPDLFGATCRPSLSRRRWETATVESNSSSHHTSCSAGEGLPASALFLCFLFWLCHTACDMLVPQPGIEPQPSTVRAWSPNHWTVKEFLTMSVQFSRSVVSNSL